MKTPARKRLLIVDDSPEALRIIEFILRDTYETTSASNGAAALELAKSSPPPDLILLDIVMPEMDGFEVCARLKADPVTREIPVIFLTAQSDASDEQRGFELGAVDYILKPFSPAIVKARVHTHLSLRAAHEELVQQLRRLMNEMEIAHRVQMSILPQNVPQIDGLEIAARYLPMASLAGDFYDFLLVDEKRVGILIADVSGHGMPSALVAAMLKISLAAQSAHVAEPAQVLAGLNQNLVGKFEELYVTAAYIYVDIEKKIIRYAGAGHPPLLMCDQTDCGPREFMENGRYLGYISDVTFTQIERPLLQGDWVLLYTDGLTEAGNSAGQEFGLQRIKELLCAHCGATADGLADQLLAGLWDWIERLSGDEIDDDITFLALHVAGPLPPCARARRSATLTQVAVQEPNS